MEGWPPPGPGSQAESAASIELYSSTKLTVLCVPLFEFERACPKKTKKPGTVPGTRKQRTLLPTSIQERHPRLIVVARTREREAATCKRLKGFPPFRPSRYHASILQSWTPRHGTSTFTLPCLATTPPDMASYACLIYLPCLLLLIHICLCAVDNCVYVNNSNTTRLVSCT